jgi:alpha-ketoglutarate-dependent taurine dioxygenase
VLGSHRRVDERFELAIDNEMVQIDIIKGAIAMNIEIIKPEIGAIVRAEKSALLDGRHASQLRELIEERGVIVFPKLGLTNQEQLQLTNHLGPAPETRGGAKMSSSTDYETKGVYVVTLDKKVLDNPEYVHGTFFWHIDGLLGNIPIPKATVLSCRRRAPKGGQTEFANTYTAFAALPADERAALEKLKVCHSMYAILQKNVAVPTQEEMARWSRVPVNPHELVMRHPSGRESMLIGGSADYVLDMPFPEGRALLARLVEWAAQPRFTYRHEWEEGDLAIWDNCGTLHRAVPYATDSGRWMDRTTVDHNWGIKAGVAA